MNIQHPSTARTLSFSQKLLVLVFGALVLTIALGLFATQPTHAASGPSLCRLTGYGDPLYGECGTLPGLTEPQHLWFSAINKGECYPLTIRDGIVVIGAVIPCLDDSKFDNINKNKGSQTAEDFKRCNDATSKEEGCVAKYISMAIAFLSGGVGIVVVIMIIIGGIQYTSSSGDPQKVGAAKQKIFNAVFGTGSVGATTRLFELLVPGGLF